MKCPIRKLRNILQYCLIVGCVLLVLFTVQLFSEGPENHGPEIKKRVEPDVNIKEAEVESPIENEILPEKVVNKNVGIENIEEDSRPEEPDPNELIDWHNWKQIRIEAERVGPGEQGKAVVISPEEESKHSDLFRANGFSGYASDKVALDRAIPDIRHKGCKAKKYRAKLPTVSVVIPFYNEHMSTLVRTFTSVINRSPEQLLLEVILVDDASDKQHLGKELEDFIAKIDKVRLIRLKQRGGLIAARLAGAKDAKAEVLIFLDSHTEANVNWLPPLLDPIAADFRTAVCPFIDVIDYNNMEYRAQDEGARGAFDWQLYYKRLPLLPEDRKHPTDPFKSPVMAGGLFAISSKFFWELGGYDPGLEIWGGEQYELSFKIWQCGGIMVDAPCSRVGHIYRKYSPVMSGGRGDFLGRNYKRVAEVWMDEYAEYVYKNRPHYRNLDAGDLTEQKALRDRLKCKPFKWFMKEVAFDLPKHYPPVEIPDFFVGEIRSKKASTLCVDAQFKRANDRIGLQNCIKDSPGAGGEQRFALTWRKDIRPKDRQSVCWDVSQVDDKAPVLLYDCHGQGGNQRWRYDKDKQWIVHGMNPRCLDCNPDTSELFVAKCSEKSETQKWDIEQVNLKQLEKWDDPTKDII